MNRLVLIAALSESTSEEVVLMVDGHPFDIDTFENDEPLTLVVTGSWVGEPVSVTAATFSCPWCLGDGQGDHAADCAKRETQVLAEDDHCESDGSGTCLVHYGRLVDTDGSTGPDVCDLSPTYVDPSDGGAPLVDEAARTMDLRDVYVGPLDS